MVFLLLPRRPLVGAVLAVVFTIAHALLARALWHHVNTDLWLTIDALGALLAVTGLFLWRRAQSPPG